MELTHVLDEMRERLDTFICHTCLCACHAFESTHIPRQNSDYEVSPRHHRLTERHDERLSQGWESITLECVKHTHVSNAALEQGDDFVVYAIHATTRGDQAQKVAFLLTDSLQDSIRWLHDEFHVGKKCASRSGVVVSLGHGEQFERIVQDSCGGATKTDKILFRRMVRSRGIRPSVRMRTRLRRSIPSVQENSEASRGCCHRMSPMTSAK